MCFTFIIDALVEAISWGFVFLLRGSSRYFCVRFVSHGLLASARLRPGQQGVELEAEPRPPLHRSGGVILQQASSGPRQWAQGFEEQARTGRPGSKPLRLLDPAKTRGHVLWYQVSFSGETPTRIKPEKDISGELCRLPMEGAPL